VTGPYTPPQSRRTQAVRSSRGVSAPAWRWWWLVPVIGLVPVLLVAVLTQGVVGRQNSPPELTGPVAQSGASSAPTAAATSVNATPAATSSPTQSAITAGAAGASATGSNAQAASGQATSVSGANASSASSTTANASATATTSNTTSANTSTTSPFVAYRVQYGDTLRTISHTYGVSMAVIAKASALQDINRLQPGQVLTIPKQPGWLYRDVLLIPDPSQAVSDQTK
jgi:LysM repeat protein